MRAQRKFATGILGGEDAYWKRIVSIIGLDSIVDYRPLYGGPNFVDVSGHCPVATSANVTLNSDISIYKKPSAKFNGTSSKINAYSDEIVSRFNGSEGSLSIFFKVLSSSVWTDGVVRILAIMRVDGNNQIFISKATDNTTLRFYYKAGATENQQFRGSYSSVDWNHVCITWSKSNNRVRCYLNGILITNGELTGLGDWAGSIASNYAAIGTFDGVSVQQVWSGWLSDRLICNRELTAVEVARLAGSLCLTPPFDAGTAANSAAPLTVPTYEASGQAMHPAVLYFPLGWNGKKYWMAMTPYPGNDSTYENPSLVCGDDGQTWAVPAGLTNPIVAKNGSSFNADPDIIVDQSNVMWMVYKETLLNTYDKFYALSSTDGVTWGNKYEVVSGTFNDYQVPAVVFDGSKYIIYFTNLNTSTLKRITSSSMAGPWSVVENCSIVIPNEIPNHIEAVYDNGTTYLMVHTRTTNKLFFSSSTDGINFNTSVLPILQKSSSGWDNSYIYRTSFIKTAMGFDMWYSGRNTSNVWGIGFTQLVYP